MIWDEIWSDLALWDGDFGGSYFNTKLFFQSHLPPIKKTLKTLKSHPSNLKVKGGTKQREKKKREGNKINTSYTPPSFQFIASSLHLHSIHLPSLKVPLRILSLEQMGMAAESQFHVLAVDDSLTDRKVIERLLRTSSYQVTTVDSGSKALEFLGLRENDESNPNTPSVFPNNHQEVEVNLVITDYCMPGMTGYDLLKKIKESSSLRNIPVVIMSSENEPSRISRCLEEGAEEFFLKPVGPSDLNKLKTHMRKTKLKDQKQETAEKLENSEEAQQPQQIQNDQQQAPTSQNPEPELESHSQPQQALPSIDQQQQSLQQANNNKRKAMEQGLSPETDRTRSRYSGIATVV